MNVMLLSISERRSEIGLRRALGDQQRDIQIQFLIESVTELRA
jgi:putative ABC transport system permease protein